MSCLYSTLRSSSVDKCCDELLWMEEGRMKGRWIGSFVGILTVAAACFVWSPPAGAAASSATVAPMSGGANCGKRAKVYDKIWSVKAHDRRVVFLRCGEFQ